MDCCLVGQASEGLTKGVSCLDLITLLYRWWTGDVRESPALNFALPTECKHFIVF